MGMQVHPGGVIWGLIPLPQDLTPCHEGVDLSDPLLAWMAQRSLLLLLLVLLLLLLECQLTWLLPRVLVVLLLVVQVLLAALAVKYLLQLHHC